MIVQYDRKFQVFISSTYKDLEIERQIVIRSILDAGHIPAGMEFFTANNETQLETMYRWIDKSDLFLLIFGGKYGTSDIVREKSFTQLEYEHAIKSNKSVHVIMLSDEYMTRKGICEDVKYKEFKSLINERSKEIANSEEGIERAVLKILIEYNRNHATGGWVRAEYASINDNENIHLTRKVEELQTENQHLKEKIHSFELERFGDYAFDELLDVLKRRTVISDNGEIISLLDIFIDHYNTLVVGFVMDENLGTHLYGSLLIFQALGLMWIATSECPQRLRTSKNGRRFYTRLLLLNKE